jgi:hypothetical protein
VRLAFGSGYANALLGGSADPLLQALNVNASYSYAGGFGAGVGVSTLGAGEKGLGLTAGLNYNEKTGFGASVGLEFGFGGQFDPDYNLGAAYNVNSIGRKGQNANISVDGRMDNYSVSAWRDIKNSNSYGGSISYSGQLNDRSILKGYTTSLNWSNGQGFSNSFNYSLSDQFVNDMNQGVAGAWDGFSNAMGNNWNNVLGGFGWLMGRKEGNAQIVNETPEESYDRIAKKWREENGFAFTEIGDSDSKEYKRVKKIMEELILSDTKGKLMTLMSDASYAQGILDAIDKLALGNKLGKLGKALGLVDAGMSMFASSATANEVAFSYLIAKDQYSEQLISLYQGNEKVIGETMNLLQADRLESFQLKDSLKYASPEKAAEIQKELNIISKRIDLFVDRIKDLNANTQYLENMAIDLNNLDFNNYQSRLNEYIDSNYLDNNSPTWNPKIAKSYLLEMNSIQHMHTTIVKNKLLATTINIFGSIPNKTMSIINNAVTKWFNSYYNNPQIEQNWNIEDAYRRYNVSRQQRIKDAKNYKDIFI